MDPEDIFSLTSCRCTVLESNKTDAITQFRCLQYILIIIICQLEIIIQSGYSGVIHTVGLYMEGRVSFRSLRSSTKNLLMKPVFNLKSYGGWSFVLVSAVLWNDLPQSIKDSQSVEHLFSQAYSGQ